MTAHGVRLYPESVETDRDSDGRTLALTHTETSASGVVILEYVPVTA